MDYTHPTDEVKTYKLAPHGHLGPMTHRLNVERLNNAVTTIHNDIQHAVNNHDIHALTVLLSRLTHYKNRLAIVKPPGFLSETVKSARSLVNELHSEVNSVLTNPVSQLVSRITAE